MIGMIPDTRCIRRKKISLMGSQDIEMIVREEAISV